MERVAVQLRIEGQVQGVGYRWWAVGEARRLGVRGWVRNRADGSVELLAVGTAAAVEALAEACAHGPASAAVREVRREAAADDGSAGFEARPAV